MLQTVVVSERVIPYQNEWEQDARVDWTNVPDDELFARYPSHADTYFWGCREMGNTPSPASFREWLCMFRDVCRLYELHAVGHEAHGNFLQRFTMIC